jgi:hypothetical protein
MSQRQPLRPVSSFLPLHSPSIGAIAAWLVTHPAWCTAERRTEVEQ